MLGFAHDDGADFAEQTVRAVEEVEFGALDVDLYEGGRRGGLVWDLVWGLFEEPVEGDAADLEGFACAACLGVFGD